MTSRTALLSAALSTVIVAGFASRSARADLFDDLNVHVGFNVGRPRPVVQRVWVEPVYETRCDRVWVEPVFENRCERVWHEAVYEDRCDRVLIPDRFEAHRETTRDYYGRRYTREVQVLVEPAHYVDRPTHVLVRAGGWEEVPQRVCVAEGHWSEVSRRVVVRDGYWGEQPVPCDEMERTRVEVDLGRHDRDEWEGRDRHDVDYRPARDSAYCPQDPRRDARGDDRGNDNRIARDHDRYARGDDHGDNHGDRKPREDRGQRY